MGLKAYLQPVPAGKTKEVIVSDRFVDEQGKPVPFVIKAISPKENEALSKSCTVKGVLDNLAFANKLIVACTVEPNMKDEELCKYYGTTIPSEVPSIMFSIGEKNKLAEEIMILNDIKTPAEKLAEAKN